MAPPGVASAVAWSVLTSAVAWSAVASALVWPEGAMSAPSTAPPGPAPAGSPPPAPFVAPPDASTWRDLGRGVVLEEVSRVTPDGPQRFWLVRVPPGKARVRVARADPQPDGRPGLQPVSDLARRTGAVAAVNGGYFSPRDRMPLGLVQAAGELVAGPLYRRAALSLEPELRIDRPQVHPWIALPGGESAEVDFLNLPPQADSLVLFTRAWGARTGTRASHDTFEAALTADGLVIGLGAGDLGIPPAGYALAATGGRAAWLQGRIQRGDRLEVRLGMDEFWGPVTEALGGGPLLVRDGTASVATDERFKPDVMRGRAARTAAGVCPDRTLVLLAVAGAPASESIGMSLQEVARTMVEAGARTAMNLDGGASTTVWAGGAVLNRPSGSRERPVANAIVVLLD